MCIVESSHESSSSSPSLIASTPPGYTFAERARPLLPNVDLAHIRGPRGGGICIFHKNNFQSTIKDLGNFTSFELLSCYFTFRDSHLLIAVIYRPGSEPVTCTFFSEFTELLSSVAKYSCDLIILGDINIHLDRDIADTKKFNNLLSSHGLVQLVTGPTHRRGHTLDVVITRPSSLVTEISAALPSLSDHSIITFSACHEPPTTTVEKVERRCYKTFDPAAFSADLQETELAELASRPINEINVNVDQLFDLYDTTMKELLDRHAPLRIVTVRKKTDCPWFDADCNASKKITRKLERGFKRTKRLEDETSWREQIKKQRRLFQQKRSGYLKQRIEEAEGDGRTLWRSLNSLLTPPADNSASNLTPDTLLGHFSSKIDDIRHATKDAPPPVFQPCPVPEPGLVAFDEVSTGDVELLLKDSTTKQCELDTAPVWLIKKLSSVFAPIIAFLVNTSIRCSTLPAQHKRAVIRPRIKKQGLDASDPGNYRPISNLSFISKFIERVIHRQLSTYAESKSLLPATQSGFRRSHSTETAVIKVYNDVVLALDSGLQTALLLLDFSAAFDCVDHDLLTLVLKTCFGITSSALDWIKSFLSNRIHFIRIGNKTSKLFHVKFGVPQGSILGPLLFIFYTTNIARIAALHGILIHLYADDTQLYIHLATRDIHQAKDKLVSCIREIQNWCASMRLRLNPTKTELIWFHRNKHPAHPLNNQCLQLDPNCIITPVNTVRDLGVLLDSSLNLKAHITSVTRSCFFHLRRIRQVKKCLNERCLRVLVQALVISRIDYCNSILTGLPAVTIHPLTTVLHAAARIIKDIPHRDHITPAYAKSTLASHPGESNVQTMFAHVQYLFASRSHLYVLIDQRALKSSRKSWTSINISWRCGGS